MMKKEGGSYKIEISEKELLSSIKFIKDLRNFFQEQKPEEISQVASILQTAIEAMILVYAEKFGGADCES